MPFHINPHLKAHQTDPAHLRQRLEEEAAELERQIAEVKRQLAEVEGEEGGGGGSNGVKGRLKAMNDALAGSSFLAGAAAWGPKDQEAFDSLKGDKGFRELLKGGLADMPHLLRWWGYGGVMARAQAKAAKGETGKKEAKGGKAKDDDEEKKDKMVLRDAVQGKVVTRFPPEASGFMHIGHAKAGLTNYMLAQKYGGRMVFRFDDTNPTKEKHEFEEAIVEDTKALGIGIDRVTYTSDIFPQLSKFCDKLLQEGKAYCDDTPVDTMREERMNRKDSKCRQQSVKENLAMWAKMKDGSAQGTVVRAKIDMQADNACMRDPVLYRVNLTPHVKTGSQYKAYPTYDFACPIVDSVDGVTHALRTSEYNDRNAQYYWVCDAVGIRKPLIEDFSRLNMEFTVMSKRKLTQFVEQGLVEAWDDPRMPTVKGLLRRGLSVQALQQFMSFQGMSKVNNFQEWGWLWNANCKIIDPSSRRYVAVARDYCVKVKIDGAGAAAKDTRLRHKKNADLGSKEYYKAPEILMEDVDCATLGPGEEVTLMDWGNAFIDGYDKAKGTASGKLHLDGDVKKTKLKATWLADVPQNKVLCELVEYDHLITSKKPPKKVSPAQEAGDGNPEEDDDDEPGGIDAVINPKTKWSLWAYGEEALGKEVKKGDIIQLERRGFFICDKTEPHVQLLSIPDGHDKLNPLSLRAREKGPAAAAAGGGGAAAPKDEKKKKKKGDERDMSLEEKRAAKKAAKAEGKELSAAGSKPQQAAGALSGASLDIRVGKILDIGPHPDADSLFVETIDLGEGKPRTIVSGLRKFYEAEQLRGALVAVLCNLKPAAMRGVESCGMVLCASTADKSSVKVLQIPEGAKPGDRVALDGLSGEPVAELPKKKVPDLLKPLRTDAAGVAHYGSAAFTLPAGPVTAELKDAVVS